MMRVMEMFRRVFILGRITTTDVGTLQAEAEVYPGVSCLDAILANVFVGACELELVEMLACLRHGFSPPLRFPLDASFLFRRR
jgi:hypothetical protein